MKNLTSRPMMTKLATLAVSLGLALSLTMGFASDTRALPKDDGLSNTNNCIYAGKTYSEGSVIVIGGQKYKCDSGEWVKARVAPPTTGSDWQLPTYPAEMAPINYYP